MTYAKSMGYLRDLGARLKAARGWVAGQYAGMLVLLLLGLGWTRIGEKHLWQVLVSLLLPVLLLAGLLVLEAGTMRRLMGGQMRVRFAWGALSLMVWLGALWLAWWILDWADGHIFEWASFLNSKMTADNRATLFTFAHLQDWMQRIEWVLRWVAVPGKLTIYALATATWGWRVPVRRVWRMLWSWRYWLGAVVASVLAVWLPGHFFAADPHGSVSAQMWRVGLKLAASYLLAVSAWVLLLAWGAVLFARQQKMPPLEEPLVAAPVGAGPDALVDAAKAEPPAEGASEDR